MKRAENPHKASILPFSTEPSDPFIPPLLEPDWSVYEDTIRGAIESHWITESQGKNILIQAKKHKLPLRGPGTNLQDMIGYIARAKNKHKAIRAYVKLDDSECTPNELFPLIEIRDKKYREKMDALDRSIARTVVRLRELYRLHSK